MKKLIKRIILATLLLAVGYGVYYCWISFPIISGYSAKNACSCAFIQGRDKSSINKEELSSFPLSMGNISIDYKDSSVTGTVLGMAKRKAIFRSGFGCTLANDISEDELRKQKFPLSVAVATQDTVDWPAGDRVIENDSAHNPLLDSAIAFAFNHQFQDKDVFTIALLIVRNDTIIAEKYAPGYNRESKFLGWSMAKSVTSALIGILVNQGKLYPDQPAPVPEWKNPTDKRHKILLEHLLQQTSGLNFTENYAKFSSVTNMLFNKGDMAGYTAGLALKHEPGTFFYYSSGNSNLLSRIVRNTVGEKDYQAFPYTALFHKIGMYHTLLEPDASGTYVGSSYVYASARDYARFGLLYLKDGVWNGERILPEGWVKKTRTSSSANGLRNYGYQFWLNGFDPNNNAQREFAEMPADLFLADGYGGQRIYIVPSMQLVVVRMGLNKYDEHRFLKMLMEGLR
jgi:CubicO group peptidase (beta-lactamase class C family)